jgi:hypothetical protein
MPNKPPVPPPVSQPQPGKSLTPAAERALAEAHARRKAATGTPSKELGGRGGPEPTRYGDWEKDGLAKDF